MITSCISWFILDTYVDQNLSENKLWFTFVCTNVSPIPVTKNSEKKRKKRMSLPYGMVPGTVYSIYISFTFTFVSKPVFKDFICKYGTGTDIKPMSYNFFDLIETFLAYFELLYEVEVLGIF